MARRKTPVCLNLTPDGVAALVALAERQRTNKSDLVNRLLLDAAQNERSGAHL